MGKLLGKKANLQNLSTLLSWPTFSVFESQTYSKAKGIPEWEQAMTFEH